MKDNFIKLNNGNLFNLNDLQGGLRKKDVDSKFYSLFDSFDSDKNEILSNDEVTLFATIVNLIAGENKELSNVKENLLFSFFGLDTKNKPSIDEFLTKFENIKESKEGYFSDGSKIIKTEYNDGSSETIIFYPDGELKFKERKTSQIMPNSTEFISSGSNYKIERTYSERAEKELREDSANWIINHVNDNLNMIGNFQSDKGFLETSTESIINLFSGKKSIDDIQTILVDQKYYANKSDLSIYNKKMGGSFSPEKYTKFLETNSKYSNIKFIKAQNDELKKRIKDLKKSIKEDELRNQGIKVPQRNQTSIEIFSDIFNSYCAGNADLAQQIMNNIAGDVINLSQITPQKMTEIVDKFEEITNQFLKDALEGETYEELTTRFQSEYKELYGTEDYTDAIQEKIGTIEGWAGLEKIAIITITQIVLGILTSGGSVAAEGAVAGTAGAGSGIMARIMANSAVQELIATYGEAKVIRLIQQSTKFLMLTGTVAEDIGLGFLNAATSENGITWEKSKTLVEQGKSSAKYIYFGGYISGPVAGFIGTKIKTAGAVSQAFKGGTKVVQGAVKTTTIPADKFLNSIQNISAKTPLWKTLSNPVNIAAGTASLSTEIGAFALLDMATEDINISDALKCSSDMQIKLKVMNRILETLLGSITHRVAGKVTATPKFDAEINNILKKAALKDINIIEYESPSGKIYSIESNGEVLFSSKDPNLLVISLGSYIANTVDLVKASQLLAEDEAQYVENKPIGSEAETTSTPEALSAGGIRNRVHQRINQLYIRLQSIDGKYSDAAADRIDMSTPPKVFEMLDASPEELAKFIEANSQDIKYADGSIQRMVVFGNAMYTPETLKQQIIHLRNMREFLDTQSIPTQMTVHRSDSYSVMEHVEINGRNLSEIMQEAVKNNNVDEVLKILNEGKIDVEYNNFVGTSLRKIDWADTKIQWEVNVPKGSKGAYVEAMTKENIPGEKEFLLQAGSTFKIKSAEFKDGIWYIKADLIQENKVNIATAEGKPVEREVKTEPKPEVETEVKKVVKADGTSSSQRLELTKNTITPEQARNMLRELGFSDAELKDLDFENPRTPEFVKAINDARELGLLDSDIDFTSVESRKEILNGIKNKINDLSENFAFLNKENVGKLKALGIEDKDIILNILVSQNEKSVNQKIDIYNDISKSENFDKQDISGFISSVTEENYDFAKILANTKGIHSYNKTRILLNTKQFNLEIAKELVATKGHNPDYVIRVLASCNEQNVGLARELLNDKRFESYDISGMLKNTQEYNLEFARKLLKNERYNVDEVLKIFEATKEYKLDIARELVNNEHITGESVYDILKAVNDVNADFARGLIRNGKFSAFDLHSILLYTKKYNLDLARELVNNEKFSSNEIANIIMQTEEYNVDFVRELINNERFAPDQVYMILSGTQEYKMDIARELAANEKINADDISKILSYTHEYTADLTRELIKNDKFEDPGYEISSILVRTEKYNVDLVKELVKSKKFNSNETCQILYYTREYNVDFARELVQKEELNYKDVVNILECTKEYNIDLARELVNKLIKLDGSRRYSFRELAESKRYTSTTIIKILENTKEYNIDFARELVNNPKLNGIDICHILVHTKEYNINFARELVGTSLYDGEDIGQILSYTQEYSIDFARELVQKVRSVNNICNILMCTKEFNLDFARELMQKEELNSNDVGNILQYTQEHNMDFARELVQKEELNSIDIKNILQYTKEYNIDFARYLVKNERFNSYDIRGILYSTNEYNMDFAKMLCADETFPKEQIGKFIKPINANNMDTAIKLVKDIKSGELSVDQAALILDNRANISYADIRAAQRIFGQRFLSGLGKSDAEIAYRFSSLNGVTNINEIPVAAKKKLIRNLVASNTDLFNMSPELAEKLPILPKTQEDYCALLPALVRSMGVETTPLTPQQRIDNFHHNVENLSTSLARISDTDFANLRITQEMPKEQFIRTVLDKVKDLTPQERQKVYDYYGFELHHNKTNETGFSITGYPVNLNNGHKLAQITDPNTRAVVEALRPEVIRFSKENKIRCNNPEVELFLNEIVDVLPEIRTMIGRAQHGNNGTKGAHDFDVMQHSLKVMQKITQDPKFETLSETDKKLMLLASLMHDITKAEGVTDKTHANESSFDTFFIAKKFKLSKAEELKLYRLIKYHEWLEFANTAKTAAEQERRLQSIAYDLQQDNLIDLAVMFTHADLKAVKADDTFHDTKEGFGRVDIEGNPASFGELTDRFAVKLKEYVKELQKTQPLLPVTKVPAADVINSAITRVNPDGSTNIKGVYKDSDGLVVIKFNEVEDWEALGFPKGSISRGIEAECKDGTANTGNIKFFVHGLDYANQLSRFDAFSLVDSDALLSVSYTERPESKFRFFRPQGVVLDVATENIHGGGNKDSGSGYKKNIQEFKNNYVFGGHREAERTYVSDLIKEATGMNDEDYVRFIQENGNKDFTEIEPLELREKIIKALATINSNTRKGDRSYNEMYISNPNVMAVFAYDMGSTSNVGNPLDFLGRTELTKGDRGYNGAKAAPAAERTAFLRQYALENNLPFIVFGD